MSQRIKINSGMKVEELLALKKNCPKRAKKFVLRVDGERYPEKEMPIEHLEYLQGVNGEIVFI